MWVSGGDELIVVVNQNFCIVKNEPGSSGKKATFIGVSSDTIIAMMARTPPGTVAFKRCAGSGHREFTLNTHAHNTHVYTHAHRC